ncbi:DUF3106 domain-containing protein [Ottowia sp.]|uniref:DUF3106 domain-containing protein n=1 Tax=Ottowia sp. TaxID=1898956 RepID=UPI003A85A50C
MSSLLPALTVVCLLAWAWPALAQPAPSPSHTVNTQLVTDAVHWGALTTEQRKALRPLATLWPTLEAEQQRKWVALASNFNRMRAEDQATLQSRMAEWAQLSPAQRTQARLNFGEARRAAPADERRAKWEEYQALPTEERQRLANTRPARPSGAAPALQPTPNVRIVRPSAGTGGQDNPGTGVATDNTPSAGSALPVHRDTLLPQSSR